VEVAYFIHGKAAAMPSDGTARYNGRFRAKLFKYPESFGDTPSSGFMRSSDMNLEFDFSDETLTGTIASIQERGLIDTDDEEYSEREGQFEITGTQKNGAEGFTATMTGTDALAEWQGIDIQGHVFGPEASEISGIFEDLNVNETRGMLGYIAAKKENQ